MESEKIILDEPTDDVETADPNDQNGENDEQAQQYLDERNKEKKQ